MKLNESINDGAKSCQGCPFRVSATECRLPTTKPARSSRSPRDHYRSYFGWGCKRTVVKPVKGDPELIAVEPVAGATEEEVTEELARMKPEC